MDAVIEVARRPSTPATTKISDNELFSIIRAGYEDVRAACPHSIGGDVTLRLSTDATEAEATTFLNLARQMPEKIKILLQEAGPDVTVETKLFVKAQSASFVKYAEEAYFDIAAAAAEKRACKSSTPPPAGTPGVGLATPSTNALPKTAPPR